MNQTRHVSALFAHVLVAAALVCCGSSHDSGVTNMQAPNQPNVAPSSRCLSSGTDCVADNDCCSQWCVNGRCTRKQP
jgi:hypothetical protein